MNNLFRTIAIRPGNHGKTSGAMTSGACNHDRGLWGRVPAVVRFGLHIVEMVLAMQVGMWFFHTFLCAKLMGDPILHEVVMDLYMTAPMVAVMVWHGHCWRHSAEMAAAMLAGPAILIACVLLHADARLPWLTISTLPTLASITMYAGMLAAMLYRRANYA